MFLNKMADGLRRHEHDAHGHDHRRQADAAQAEQLARRGLTYANGRPALQASLWELIAQARDKQGDPAGAAQARQRAQVSS